MELQGPLHGGPSFSPKTNSDYPFGLKERLGIQLSAEARMRVTRFLLLMCVACTACSRESDVTAMRLKPSYLISDAVHEGGTPGFYFLPPMVSQPSVSG